VSFEFLSFVLVSDFELRASDFDPLIRNIIETRAASGGSLPAAQAVFGRTRREFQLVSV
jgi:hypothetical protein